MGEREASCDRRVHKSPPESRTKHVEGSGEGGSTGNHEMVEIVQLAGGVSANAIADSEVNKDIPEHGRPPLNTICL
jgi:hypothetical protein